MRQAGETKAGNKRRESKTVKVELGEREYKIVVSNGAIGSFAGSAIGRLCKRAMIVTNRKVDRLYGEELLAGLGKAKVDTEKIIIADGEKYKRIETVMKIHDRLVNGSYDRDSMVIALGGGVTGDMAGFASATYLRGIRYVQVPTTLLAQVDSSVGGKTGVNHPLGKNLIGAFHQPSLVVADTATLGSLPRRELLCGIAEVIKYGAIASSRFFSYLEKSMSALLNLDGREIINSVARSCTIKAEVVADDELEKGRRAILNFGHTAGHALEAVTGYKKYKHGEAVAIGMSIAAKLSMIKGYIDKKSVQRIDRLILSAGLPIDLPKNIDRDEMISAMGHDKKVKDGAIRFSLLDKIGNCRLPEKVDVKDINNAMLLRNQ